MEAVTFTTAVKEDLASAVYLGFQRGEYVLPAYRDLIQQIHSIKKTITSGGHMRFDAERNDRGHADKFWSFALGEYAVGSAVKSRSGFYSQLRNKKSAKPGRKEFRSAKEAIKRVTGAQNL